MSAAVARMPQPEWSSMQRRAPRPQPRVNANPAPLQKTERATAGMPVSSLAFYRRYTELLLRRYMQLSLRMGRVPSVLGNCMFRGRVSSREMRSFEDTVIFVYDVERCMKALTPEDRELIARVALQEHTQAEAAAMTGQSLRTVVRKYGEAIDTLTRMFLDKELLEIGPMYKGM